MKNFLKVIILAFSIFSLGCFEQLQSPGTGPFIKPYLGANDFLGVEKVDNLTTGLLVSWKLGNESKAIMGYRVYRFNLNKYDVVATVAPNVSSYIDGNVVSGVKYKYKVKAIDPSDKEDANVVEKSRIFWNGLSSVTSLDQSRIQVTFSNQLKGYRISIYLQGEGRPKTKIVDIERDEDLSLGNYNITQWADGSPLKPGSAYQVSAQIFELSNLDETDQNNIIYNVSTLSYGFHNVSGNKQGWNNVAIVRAFGESPGVEVITNDLATSLGIQDDLASTDPYLQSPRAFITPKDRAQVEVGFLPFSMPQGFPASNYRYKVIRALEGQTFDSSTLSYNCPTLYSDNVVNGSLVPCIVRENFHPVNDLENGLIVARDIAVWRSTGTLGTINDQLRPPRYRYFVTLQHLNDPSDITKGSFTENIPANDFSKFSVLVPIPPANMVLVNRESVNYELCVVQQKKASDALKFNRCDHGEAGSVTFNSGPGKSDLKLQAGYFDFGYNLFVDRYPLSCNLTKYGVEAGTGSYSISAATNGVSVTARDQMTIYSLTGASQGSVNTILNNLNNGEVLYSLIYGGSGEIVNGGIANCSYVYDPDSNAATANNQLIDIGSLTTTFSSSPSKMREALNKMLTNSPARAVSGAVPAANMIPKFNFPRWTASLAQTACSTFSVTGYGAKRIPRMREYRAYMAQPFSVIIDGKNIQDLYRNLINPATDISTINQNTWKPGSCLYNTAANPTTLKNTVVTSMTALNAQNTNVNASQLYGNNNNRAKYSVVTATVGGQATDNTVNFMLGAEGNSLCMSRYGVSDIIESSSTYANAVAEGIYSSRYATSDLFSWTSTNDGTFNGMLTGLNNNKDQGNYDLSYYYDGTNGGYKIGFPAIQFGSCSVPGNSIMTNSFCSNIKFNQVLGIPAISDGPAIISNYTLAITDDQNYGMSTVLRKPAVASQISLEHHVSYRYTTSFDDTLDRVRCVLSAD